mmetsp:Transcript_50973/g.119137  ORF Transcript_50973/g.119137 Transcript_50973/m.119137 type:complete len:536 (+) Transcript_50973:125-1732(+)
MHPGFPPSLQMGMGVPNPAVLASLQQQAMMQNPYGAPHLLPFPAAMPVQVMQASATSSTSPATAVLENKEEGKAPPPRKASEVQQQAEQARCHLHKKEKKGCKFCQRQKDFVDKVKEERADLRERFINKVRGGLARIDGKVSREGPVELVNSKTYGLPPLLQSHIVESTHFKTLLQMESFEEIVDEVHRYADTVEPYMQGSTLQPSPLMCCVYRFFTLGLDGQQLEYLCESEEAPMIRCAGFLIVRFGLAAEELWPRLGEYTLDTEEMRTSKDSDATTTIGEFVEDLMTQERYYSTVFPRLPASVKKQLDIKLAQVPQYRRRAVANQSLLDVYMEGGVEVEACAADGEWQPGETVEMVSTAVSRPKVRIRLADGRQEVVHLGKVIITDPRYVPSGRRGSSAGTIDWSYEKGKSATELMDEMRNRDRERAVCTSGKDYARRPVSCRFAMPMEQGSASHRLAQDETTITPQGNARRGAGVAAGRERSRSREPEKSRGPSAEHQARMLQIFEKYGMAKGAEASGTRTDLEGPEVMQLK